MIKIKKRKTIGQNGITLVALIITIIILLILAGISISSLTNTGLFKKAQEAKQKTENAQELENEILSEYEKQIVGNRANETEESKIIKNFEIELTNITDKSIEIAIKENIETIDQSKIIGYIVFLNNKAIDITKETKYTINSLDSSTEYSGIYLKAIDENGNLKKSANEIKTTTKELYQVLEYPLLTADGFKNVLTKDGYIFDKSVNCIASDAVPTYAFDGNLDTVAPGGNVKSTYLDVDSSAAGLTLKFIFTSSGYHNVAFFVDGIAQGAFGSREQELSLEVPAGANRITIYYNEGGGCNEISIVK